MEKLKSFRHLNNNIDLVLNEENSIELLGAQGHIWNQIFNFINSMSLKCAIQLGIPDIVNNYRKPMTISQLVLALPINQKKSPCVYRLMRILIHSGFFALQKVEGGGEGEEEEGYVITDASKLLLKDNPMSVTPFLLSMLDPVMTKPWDFLSNWFQNDDPTPFDTANGMTFWDYGSHQPNLARFFNDAMASDARLVTSVVIEKCKWVFEGVESLVDVGGGTGTVATSIATNFPQIQCTVLDLPHVVADLQGGNNLNFVGGDMFVEVPTAEVVLLKWILHDWNDEESVKILKKCKEAIMKSKKKGGKVIIIDMKVENEKDEDDESYETQLFFDMLMMTLLTGKERNEKEWAKLFKDAGFSDYKITPILGLRSVIESLRPHMELNLQFHQLHVPKMCYSIGYFGYHQQLWKTHDDFSTQTCTPHKQKKKSSCVYRLIVNMEKLKSFRHLNNNIDLVLNEENSIELLRAQGHIWNQIFNFINSMSLKCAIQLGIPDIINNYGKPMTISQLKLALPINQKKSSCVYRLMRILTHSNFFALQKVEGREGEEEEEGYVITDASKLLLKDNPMSVTPFLLAMLDPVITKPWDFLSNWFQNDDPTPFDTANGMTFWDYGSHQPNLARFFNDAMASDARLVTSVVIEKCRWVFEGVESLVDVGGGTGTVATTIATSFPQIQCSVLDLPHVVADLQGANNLWILHDWNDEESVKILKKCKEAITKNNKKGGKVIIIDMKVENEKDEDDESYETQLFFDMLMMALVTGKERNEKEWAKLFKDAGFSDYKITPILGLRSLIEVYP
ncbi:hypothetical protein G4B88_008892 [Cannabis sativa]|uniref:O-methyltransferase n=1 Tax=Cannabis sativa TaxID=3483 RepID=A0A7J6HP59_CANSA|nr:hypothetical protein G4B88_008892 [Cannabis sativa]